MGVHLSQNAEGGRPERVGMDGFTYNPVLSGPASSPYAFPHLPICQCVDDGDNVDVVLGAAPGEQEAVCLDVGVAGEADVVARKCFKPVGHEICQMLA